MRKNIVTCVYSIVDGNLRISFRFAGILHLSVLRMSVVCCCKLFTMATTCLFFSDRLCIDETLSVIKLRQNRPLHHGVHILYI